MKFETFAQGMQYVSAQEKQIGKMKYRSTPEYHALKPHLDELYRAEELRPTKKRRVEVRFCISG